MRRLISFLKPRVPSGVHYVNECEPVNRRGAKVNRGLKDIKVGDRVWITNHYQKRVLRTVKKLTPTQIVVENWNGASIERFERGKPPSYPHLDPSLTYRQIAYYGFGSSPEITRIATKAECKQWDAEQEQKRIAAEAAEVERKRKESLREELNALFGRRKVSISEAHHQDDVQWQATVYLTEDGVRRLAVLLDTLSAIQLPSWDTA